MSFEINDAAREVLDFAEHGSLFETPDMRAARAALVTTSLKVMETWLYTHETPGGRGRDWLNLRENMVGKINAHGWAMDHEDHGPYRDLSSQLFNRIEKCLCERLPAPFSEYENDITADLAHCALSRALGCTGPHADLFEMLFDMYRAGLLPCGWEGEYPNGSIAVYVHGRDKRRCI